MAPFESLGQGLPVGATAVGGVAELVRDGQDGLITRSGDVAGLAAAVIRLWREPALRRAMSESGRSRVAGNSRLNAGGLWRWTHLR